MVELKGSEKQVKWAEEIRQEVLKQVQLLEKYKNETEFKKEATKGKSFERLENFKIYIMEEESNSKFYIDNFADLTYIKKDIEKVEKNEKHYNFVIAKLNLKMFESFFNSIMKLKEKEEIYKISARMAETVIKVLEEETYKYI